MSSRQITSIAAIVSFALCARAFGGTIDSEIILTLDVSPSISQAELDLERQGILDCLNNTNIIPHDGTVAVGIVTYGHIAWDILNLTPVTDANLTNIITPALNSITRGLVAQTNISAGLQHAQAMLTGMYSQTNNDFILLAGDGAHNTGNPEPEVTCPQVRSAGTTICSIAIDASLSGINDLQMCAHPPDGQFGIADTFMDFGPVCQACLAFFLDVQCVGPTVCTDPGVCTATIPCASIADCEAPPGTQITRVCTPPGPYALGTSSVNITCQAGGEVIEQMDCNVTVNDCENPVITCPANRTIACDESTAPSNTGAATATDNCGGSPMISIMSEQTGPGSCGGTSIIHRIWKATDASGNSSSCMQTITTTDTVAPNLSCPEAVYLTCNQSAGVPTGSVNFNIGRTDNCDSSVALTDDRPGGFFPPTCAAGSAPTVVTFHAMDDCGNPAMCSVDVFVVGDACCPVFIELDTDLTLLPVGLDVRQETEGPIKTKANFDIWNSNEVRFSGTERCVTCWDETLFSQYGIPNHFFLENLQTDKGKARIDGLSSPVVCPTSIEAPMLGVAIKEATFVGDTYPRMRSASVLTGIGAEIAQIRYDLPEGPDLPGASAPPGTPVQPGDPDGPSLPAFSTLPNGIPAGQVIGGLPSPGGITSGGAINTTNIGGINKKGSLLYWVKIELKWNAAGQLIQDTFVSLLNDNIDDVRVKLYQVNGDAPLDPVIINGELIERGHPGWNNSDIEIVLTPDESAYWSAASGQPKGVSPFVVLDYGTPPGRPDNDPHNPGGHVLRGFLVAWAINGDVEQIRWNHLVGKALVINYAQGTAWEYEAWSFQCVDSVETGDMCGPVVGELNLDGAQYEAPPDRLLLDFFSTGSRAFSLGGGSAP